LQCDTLARLLKAHYPQVWGDALTVTLPQRPLTDELIALDHRYALPRR
jgi:hypothetical protein